MSSETKKELDLKTVAIGAVAFGAVVFVGATLLRSLKKRSGRTSQNVDPAAAKKALESNPQLLEAVNALKSQLSLSADKLEEIKKVRVILVLFL